MNIDITDGEFISSSYYAVDEYNLNYVKGKAENSEAFIEEISISGGNFNGSKGAILSDNMEYFITDGTFSHDPSAYVATGYKAVKNADNKYDVVPMGDNEAAVVPAEPTVDVPNTITEEEKTA